MPAVAIGLVAGLWVLWAVTALSPPGAWLRGAVSLLTVVLLSSVPVASGSATHALVLRTRGVTYLGTVTGVQRVRVKNGYTYRCTIGYAENPGSVPRSATVDCLSDFQVGELDYLVVDPRHQVSPELEGDVLADHGDAGPGSLAVVIFALLVSAGAVGAGALHARRAARRRTPPELQAALDAPPGGSPR